MVGEVEPVVLGAEHLERGEVLLTSHGDDVITRSEAAERVPLGHLGRVVVGEPGEHGAHRRAGVGQEQVAGAHGRVVEVR